MLIKINQDINAIIHQCKFIGHSGLVVELPSGKENSIINMLKDCAVKFEILEAKKNVNTGDVLQDKIDEVKSSISVIDKTIAETKQRIENSKKRKVKIG